MDANPLSPEGYDRVRRGLFESREDGPVRLGKYLLLREVGRGGMGIVFEAEDPDLHRLVALKVLRDGEGNPKFVRRLHREAAIAAQLRHPNIVGIYEVGTAPDSLGRAAHYIAMDFVDGRTLADVLRDGRTPRAESLRILEETARAVAFAHAKGVVHRDLKPPNVLVEKTGRVLLTDFGLARAARFATRLTRSQAVMGTPQYMAPEQVEGRVRDVGPQADVYALGVMLYEILAGRLPFAAETPAGVYARILRGEPPRLRVERDLEAICSQAMEVDTSRRTATALEFAEDLRRFREGEPIRARSPSPWRRWTKKAGRNRALTAMIAVLMIAIGWRIATEAAHRRRLESEQGFREKREAFLRRLAAQWLTITERKRDLRSARPPASEVRRGLEEAVRGMDELIREWPNDPQGCYVRARGRLALDDLEGAERDLRAAVVARPDFRPGWSLLGSVKVEQFQRELHGSSLDAEARKRQRAATLNEATATLARGWETGRERIESERWGLPWTREDRVTQVLARGLRLYYQENDRDGARNLLEEELRDRPEEEYANRLGNWSTDAAEKIRRQDQAIALAPGYAKAYRDRGDARLAAGDPAGAVTDYTSFLELRGEFPEAYHNRGIAKSALRDFAGAVEDYTRAIEIRADLPEAFNNRGNAKLSLRDLPGAHADYDRAIELCPRFAEAYHNRGCALEALEKFSEAVADYTRALDLSPNFADAYLSRAIAEEKLGRIPCAIEDLERSLRVAPDNWTRRATIEERLKDLRSSP